MPPSGTQVGGSFTGGGSSGNGLVVQGGTPNGQGINVAGGSSYGPVGSLHDHDGDPLTPPVLQTGAMHLRAASATRTNLARGLYEGLAGTLNTLNYQTSSNPGLPPVPENVQGAVLRNSGLFPENFIKVNPQFNNATWNSNSSHQNYHSLQIQGTLRPTYGVNLQATYTWSKTLGIPGDANFTTPFDRHLDYTLQQSHRSHDFRTYGTFNLPVGPNQLVAGNSTGWVARVIEGWQMSWIFGATTGAPGYIQANDMLYDAGVPDLVGPFDPKEGKVQWADGAAVGNYFGDTYTKVPDPQCGLVTPMQGLQGRCDIDAVALASDGTIVLQNPLPGTRGNLGQNVIELPGTWTLDSSVAKSVQIMEDLALRLRFDALNLLNHPQPGNPVLNINSGDDFGEIDSKSGNRVFKLEMKLEF